MSGDREVSFVDFSPTWTHIESVSQQIRMMNRVNQEPGLFMSIFVVQAGCLHLELEHKVQAGCPHHKFTGYLKISVCSEAVSISDYSPLWL